MIRSGTLIAILVALVLGAACSQDSTPSDPAESPSATPISEFPKDCDQQIPPTDETQISFTKGGSLYISDITGQTVRCVAAELPQSDRFTWSPDGTTAGVDNFGTVTTIGRLGGETVTGPGTNPLFQGFSEPEGNDLLFISAEGAKLEEVEIASGKRTDISFLRRHDEAVYHPSGGAIAVMGALKGTPSKTDYGIYLVNDRGEDLRTLVKTRNEDNFYAMDFSPDGDTLYYVADLHDRWQLRSVPTDEGENPEETILSTVREPILPIVSRVSDDIAYREGSCDTGFTTSVLLEDSFTQISEDGDSQPIGWTNEGELVTGLTEDLCDPAWVMDLYVGGITDRDLLVEDVDEAAVRPAG
jgi:hypothetical protein